MIRTVWMIIAFFAVQLIEQNYGSYSPECKYHNVLYPCWCYEDEYDSNKIGVFCTYCEVEDIKAVIKRVSFYNFNIFDFYARGTKWYRLDKNQFLNNSIHTVEMNTPNLETIDNEAFDSLKNFVSKIIVEGKFREIPYSAFKNLQKLEDLQIIRSSKITIVKEDGFYGFKSTNVLTHVSFKDNSIDTIENGAFNHLLNLKQLDLSNNNLNHINPNAFNPSQYLHHFYFDNNTLVNIPMEVVEISDEVTLNGNLIANITSKELGYLVGHNMKFISFDGNPINCGCSMLPYVKYRQELGYIDSLHGIQCHSPPNLENKMLQTLQTSDFKDC